MSEVITFAIPYYENEAYLKKAVQSVLNQTATDWSLIISLDNALSDSFLSYIESLSDNRISIVYNFRSGIAGNWQNCINESVTEYTTILHSDDELKPNYISIMNELIKNHPRASLYFCDAAIIDENSNDKFSFIDFMKQVIRPKEKLYKLEGDDGLSSLLDGCYIFCPTICYKTDVIKKEPFSDKWFMVLDFELYARLLFKKHRFVGTKKIAYKYRRHNSNQTAKLTKDLKRFREEIKLYNKISNCSHQMNWKKSQETASNKFIIKKHIYYLAIMALLKFDIRRVYDLVKFRLSEFN